MGSGLGMGVVVLVSVCLFLVLVLFLLGLVPPLVLGVCEKFLIPLSCVWYILELAYLLIGVVPGKCPVMFLIPIPFICVLAQMG